LLPAFRDAARSQHMRLYMAAQSSCRPLIGMHSETSLPVAAEQRRQDVCAAFNAAMLGAVKQLDPDIVMLAGFWNLPDFLAPASPIATRAATRQFGHALDETLGRVAQPGRRVCAVLDVPDRKFVVPYALAMARRRGLSTDFLRLTRVAAIEQQRIVDTVFAERAREGRLELVDPKSVLCAGVDCELQTPNGSPLYNDANHLSAHGARLLVDPLAQCARAVP
jgi:hypothetical protein